MLLIISKCIRHTDCHRQHHHDKTDADKQDQIIRYILEHDTHAEAAHKLPMRKTDRLFPLGFL